MDYKIREANLDDLPDILEIYAGARAFMAKTGNPNQWKNTHPARELLERDTREGNLYVLSDGGKIHGVFAFLLGEDPTYRVIEGSGWRSSQPYGTIHRIAGDGSGGILHACVGFCRKQIGYLRIDTHEDNRVMQGALKKEGFVPCGIIHIADGSPRIAYDLL